MQQDYKIFKAKNYFISFMNISTTCCDSYESLDTGFLHFPHKVRFKFYNSIKIDSFKIFVHKIYLGVLSLLLFREFRGVIYKMNFMKKNNSNILSLSFPVSYQNAEDLLE